MATVNAKPTQAFVPIKEIRDGVLILKNGGLRSVLLASSLNFALKSADEQQAIIYQFQNFLNSLNFSVQIYTQSRKLDIRPYIGLLEERLKEQMSDLMKMQTREYIEFIKSFTESTNIMTKSFFIIVPYSAPILGNRMQENYPLNPQNLINPSSDDNQLRRGDMSVAVGVSPRKR